MKHFVCIYKVVYDDGVLVMVIFVDDQLIVLHLLI